MRKTKKFASLLLALVLMLALSITVSAAGYTVTIDDGDVTGASYAAYKLMDVTTGTTKDSNTGETVTTFSYTVNSKYSSVLQAVTGKSTDEAVIEYIANLATDAETIAFADDLYQAIIKANLSVDATAHNNTFSDMSGYYLIVETATGTTSSGTSNEAYSSAILQTIYSNATISTKEDVPELTKKVWETNDSEYTNDGDEWQDAADYDIGDDVPFRLTATISDYYDDYDEYTLTFHDTLSAGLTFNNDVAVYVVNGNTVTELNAADYTVTYTAGSSQSDGCTFHVQVTDLKKLQTSVSVTKGSVVRVEYTAKLNENAVVGQGSNQNNQGNPNVAYLEYSNNPYNANDTGKTPEDKVTVFTFKLDVDKYDDTGEKLNGAGFTLYKWYATGSGANDGDWKQVGDELVYTNSDGYEFTWTGLDSGEYKIVETTVPSGYTKAEDITFTVSATYDTSSDNPTLTALSVVIGEGEASVVTSAATHNVETGIIEMGIINKRGNSLPRTGGIGTTIFYIVGGILVVGAGVLLITKKCMNKAR
ncbi:MAG: isopeptide-forming domain-containing fimbrial protein [Oscillospiraceae bacterium]|nr:isopeptide-forming domain-containing fimbrial protein [Oscillospiraceae bacterium]